jgi:ryanodine receptor 2
VYVPKPIDTAHITLPESLLGLTERLAENVHDTWAKRRMAEGWTFGPKRDDAAKQHPCLVPYAQLPDSEKQYDRDTAQQSIKAIIALGYHLEKA